MRSWVVEYGTDVYACKDGEVTPAWFAEQVADNLGTTFEEQSGATWTVSVDEPESVLAFLQEVVFAGLAPDRADIVVSDDYFQEEGTVT